MLEKKKKKLANNTSYRISNCPGLCGRLKPPPLVSLSAFTALPPPKSTSEASLTRDSSCVDLKTCYDVQYEVRDGVHGVSYHFSSDEGMGWTLVVGRRQKR